MSILIRMEIIFIYYQIKAGNSLDLLLFVYLQKSLCGWSWELGEWDFEYLAMSKDKNRQIEYETIEKDGAFFDKIDPLNHTDRIVSPLMVLHGVKDPRVSIEESDQ